jgi:LruC domain-containing protein
MGINFAKSYLYLSFIFGLTLFTACQERDYYDSSNSTGTGTELFGDSVAISSSFGWSTTKTVNLTVAVDDQYEGKYLYRVEVYDANPLFDEGASLLGAGVAKTGQNFVSKIVAPTGAQTLYVEQTDPRGLRSVSAVSASSSDITLDLAPTATASKTSSLKSANLVSLNSANVTTEPAVPSDAIEINNNVSSIDINPSKGKNYVIKKGVNYTGTININGWGQGVSLYIEGSWTNSSSSASLETGDYLYVFSGASLNINQITANNSAKFYNYGTSTLQRVNFTNTSVFENNGVLSVAGVSTFTSNVNLSNTGTITFSSFEITDNFTFTNSGSVTAGDATISNGSFVNTGTATFANISSTTSSTTIQNEGTLKATTASLTNATLIANCHTTVQTLTTNGAKIYISGASLLDITTLSSGGTNFYLAASAILKVSSSAYFNSSRNFIHATGATKALAKIRKVASEWQGITYQGNLQIECAEHTANTDYGIYYVLDAPAAFVPSGESSIEIAGTNCNDGGNNVAYKGAPASQVFPIIYSENGLTYLFEDNWPYLGDFDMNDVVLDMVPTYSVNSDNKITQLILNVKLRAVGATRKIAVGLQLDGVSSSNVTVTRSNTAGINGSVFSQSNNIETGQSLAVIPLFDEAHLALANSNQVTLINTVKGSSNNVSPLSVTFTIAFNSPVSKENVSVDKFNVFVVNGGTAAKRQEVHMPGFEPTAKANLSKFGTADDNSLSGLKYTSKNNLIWGLAVPAGTSYPVEWTSIGVAYPNMKAWATSIGVKDTDWYKVANSSTIY